MYNLRNELMHYTNDLPDGVDLKAEAVAVIEQIAQYMTKEALLNHSRPLALAYLALTEEVDAVPVVRCKDCKFNSGAKKCLNPNSFIAVPADDDFCSYGEKRA